MKKYLFLSVFFIALFAHQYGYAAAWSCPPGQRWNSDDSECALAGTDCESVPISLRLPYEIGLIFLYAMPRLKVWHTAKNIRAWRFLHGVL